MSYFPIYIVFNALMSVYHQGYVVCNLFFLIFFIFYFVYHIHRKKKEFHYNTFEKTKDFNQFHVYGSSDDLYRNRIYLK